MAITQLYSLSAVSVGSSELSVVSGTTSLSADTTDGIYQAVFDPVAAAMAKGDTFQLKAYEKCLSGSTKRVAWSFTVLGAQTELIFTPPLVLMHGWDFTIKKIGGTDRSWDASIRQIA